MGRLGKIWIGLSIWSLALAYSGSGESVSAWRVYKLPDGLAESACLAISFGPNGKLLARHLNVPSSTELNGYEATAIPIPTGSGRIYSSPAGQLWTAGPEGLLESRDGAWVRHDVPEIRAVLTSGTARVIDPLPLYPLKLGVTLVLLPDRLLEVNCQDPGKPTATLLRAANETGLGRFTGLTSGRNGSLWVSAQHGLARLPGPARNLGRATVWQELPLPPGQQLEHVREPQEGDDGVITAVADSGSTNPVKVVLSYAAGKWTVHHPNVEKIRRAWRGSDGLCWAITIDALVAGPDWSTLAETEEISARQYFDVTFEPGGAFWVATSEGLYRHAALSWHAAPRLPQFTSAINCLVADPEGGFWFSTASALHHMNGDQTARYAYPRPFATQQGARQLFRLPNGSLVLEGVNQLLQFNPDTAVFAPVPPRNRGTALKPLGVLADGRLCLQAANARTNGLEAYDGATLEPCLSGAPPLSRDGSYICVFATGTGDIWISGEQAVAYLHDRKWTTFLSTDRSTPEGALGFVALAGGQIWCATRDLLWEYDGKAWAVVRQGFDRISGLTVARDGSVWVPSNSGLHRHFKGAWLEHGVQEGLPAGNIRAVMEDQRARIWAATTRGLSLFRPEADPDPPQTFIRPLPEKDNNVPDGVAITMAFRGVDRWKYTSTERLLYSYRLDNNDWSEYHERNAVALHELGPGKHIFQVRAVDRNGNFEPRAAQLDFAVVLPWYRETRLVVISIAGLAAALFFAGIAINRHRQLLRSYAAVELTIAERTSQLECANRELLHSQKMTALGTLAAGIAHDFNNILSIIKGSAQLIEDNLDKPEKVRTRLDRINTVVEQGAGIVKAMLGFSRNSDRQQERCELNAVVEDTIKLVGDRFLREVQLRFEPDRDLPKVILTRDFVQQILLNFLFNAADAIAAADGSGAPGSERNSVVLETGWLQQLSQNVVLAPDAAPSYAAVTVRDYGCGISPETLPRIFEPFFTTKALSTRRGTGLGLSMAYELARKLGAGIAVDSKPGEGSAFTLVLPVYEAKPEKGIPGGTEVDYRIPGSPPQTSEAAGMEQK